TSFADSVGVVSACSMTMPLSQVPKLLKRLELPVEPEKLLEFAKRREDPIFLCALPVQSDALPHELGHRRLLALEVRYRKGLGKRKTAPERSLGRPPQDALHSPVVSALAKDLLRDLALTHAL